MYAIGDSAMCQLIFIAFYTMDCYLRMRKNMLLRVLTLQFGIADTYTEEPKHGTIRAHSTYSFKHFYTFDSKVS